MISSMEKNRDQSKEMREQEAYRRQHLPVPCKIPYTHGQDVQQNLPLTLQMAL
jgi:hypothetical protein